MTTPKFVSAEALFASPLLTFRVPDSEALNTQLEAEANAMRAADDGVTRSNRNGWHSPDDFFRRHEPGCSALRSHIAAAVHAASLHVSPKLDFGRWLLEMEGWININGRGGFNAPHDHPGFAWSGVYYVRVPASTAPDSGSIEFLDPRTNARVPTVDGAACFMDTRRLAPREGLLLMFPSYLRHWVYPNEEESERISIAFNARLKPRPAKP